ncbi:MAG: UbiX family flavin prenyltransferase [Alphaproteobacteria bacterium]|nr:UbiX family flavin prenyltransferase [Alphaproteobacteria bacterium]
MTKRLIVGLSGASGIIYGLRMLEALRDLGHETHLVMSRSAEATLAVETTRKVGEVHALAHAVYPVADVGAALSSGSFATDGMVIAPCSIRSLSEIATGVTSTLLTRAADVTLKERRRLVLLVREAPLHTGHLRTMTQASEMGAVIFPPVPAFYGWPASVDDIVNHTVGRVLDLFGIENSLAPRWGAVPEAGGKAARAFPGRTEQRR